MNKKIDSSFDRVEKALGTLIDSIAKYNPSTSQVEELGNADAELTKGLKDRMPPIFFSFLLPLLLKAPVYRPLAQSLSTRRRALC